MDCVAVLVGVQTDTSTVEMIWIGRDGAMTLGDLTHLPQPGRSAAGEAITEFGMTRLRRFLVCDLHKADAYAARLRRELSDDAPQIL